MMGVQVATVDIFCKFRDVVTTEVEALWQVAAAKTLEQNQQDWLETMDVRLVKLQARKYKELYVDRIMEWGKVKVGGSQVRVQSWSSSVRCWIILERV